MSASSTSAAALEPVDQLPGYDWNGGLAFYRESGNTATRFFIGFLNAGSYRLSYDATARVTGSFMGGICTVPASTPLKLTAHTRRPPHHCKIVTGMA